MRHSVKEADKILDHRFTVLDHGYVELVDYMGSDRAIAQAARTSTQKDQVVKTADDDRSLIRYLVRNRHTSPLEMVELKFVCQMPIFVARQWIRHRTASVNEVSGRYSELPDLTYVPSPDVIGYQSQTNKQGRVSKLDTTLASEFARDLQENQKLAFDRYHTYLGKTPPSEQDIFPHGLYADMVDLGGISREIARINLPLSTYTKWYWKIDLHNLLHFLFLRLDPHAQYEIRQYALTIAGMVQKVCPVAWDAFLDYRIHSTTLSAPETEFISYKNQGQGALASRSLAKLSQHEIAEFEVKLSRLGLSNLLTTA